MVHVETCTKTTCKLGFHAVEVHGSTGGAKGCCPRIECVPDDDPCPVASEPACGEFQEVKTITDDVGCTRYICGKNGELRKNK